MHCIEIHNAFLLKQRRDCTQSERYKSSERECARVYYVTGVYAVWWQNSLCRMLLHTAAADSVRENYAARANLFSDFPGIYIYIHIREASGRYLIMISIPLLNHAFPMHIAYYAHRTAYSLHPESISTRCTLNFSSCQAHRCRRRGPGRYTVPWPQTAACFANEPSKLPAK